MSYSPPKKMLICKDIKVSFKSHRIACKVYFLQWRQKIRDTGHLQEKQDVKLLHATENSGLWKELITAVWGQKKKKNFIAQILH